MVRHSPKKGASAMGLQRLLDLAPSKNGSTNCVAHGSVSARDHLSRHVAVNRTYVGGEETNAHASQILRKSLVAIPAQGYKHGFGMIVWHTSRMPPQPNFA
jgi:hypothetical protein